MKLNTAEDFTTLVNKIQSKEHFKKPIGFGIARLDKGQVDPNKVLQANYAFVNWNENFGSAALFLDALEKSGETVDYNQTEQILNINNTFLTLCLDAFNPFIKEANGDKHKNIQVIKQLTKLPDLTNFKAVFIFKDEAPQTVETVYLKLYSLSLGKAPIRSLNLNGAFGILQNVAWVGNKPLELDYLRANEIELKLTGNYPQIDMVDKFPRFLQHIIPANNTRILDASKVRFGAQLGAGTTVMPGASYINFNAGTTGPVMVEGRISSSAIVGEGSDIGGGASILGVLSGTDGNPISIGKNTLLGANSVTGIPLGDGCIVDAGVSILAGTKLFIETTEINKINEVNDKKITTNLIKAKEISGFNGIHFRVDSTNGKIVAKRSTREVKLNTELH
ncbi:MAG: tetrahydrodipicolinate N-succinyltransferase N-terminal domain-containing protein [Solirubrobacteraceae bacterium]